ncbi:MAG: hypothetical protein QNJ46_20055 [Leptolyngbyaceae cyanobacterium MO_188.B28]|nr:hypothetical protein [Leptolyngbyaceae cyanobacterium MO_188.B28]
MDKPLTISDFRPHLSSKFYVHCDKDRENLEALETKLTEINELKYDRRGDLGKAFTLTFLGELEPILPQKIYQFEHQTMGKLNMFVVPIGPDREGKGMCYEAVFS